MITNEMTAKVIKCAYKVHNTLGAGFLEKVYENAMVIDQQYNIPVFYEDKQVGDYYADLFVNKELILELKAVENLNAINEVKLVNYLAGTRFDVGLLINFGSSVEVKKKYRVYTKQKN